MIPRARLLTTLAAASLASAALATSDHPSTPSAPTGTPDGSAMSAMHDAMVGGMHDMMAQMNGTPAGAEGGMHDMHGSTSSTMPSLQDLSGEAYEVAFLSMMIAHHRGATNMANWILERTDDPEVRATAEAITAAQDPEIQQMTAWLREWYDQGVDADWAGMMNADMAGMMQAMEEGADPDAAFLVEMIRHHQGAIDMAQFAIERAVHPEVRDLARDVILAQAEEVHQYQTWLSEERSE